MKSPIHCIWHHFSHQILANLNWILLRHEANPRMASAREATSLASCASLEAKSYTWGYSHKLFLANCFLSRERKARQGWNLANFLARKHSCQHGQWRTILTDNVGGHPHLHCRGRNPWQIWEIIWIFDFEHNLGWVRNI